MTERFRGTRPSMNALPWSARTGIVSRLRRDGSHPVNACNHPPHFPLHGTRSSSIIIYPSLNIHSIILTTILVRWNASSRRARDLIVKSLSPPCLSRSRLLGRYSNSHIIPHAFRHRNRMGWEGEAGNANVFEYAS